MLILGICLVLFAIISVLVCIHRTPDNLRGFYGTMYWILSIGSFIGGTVLIISELLRIF